MKKLALFDFDGTLTSKDTLFDIARFSNSPLIYWSKIALLLPSFVLMKIGILPKQKGKEVFIGLFFSNKTEQEFNDICAKFCFERLPQIIRPKGHKEIEILKSQGADLFIVSASPKNWILPWALPMGIQVLSTELAVKNGRITGKIVGENCNGVEKVNRIKQAIPLENYNEIYVYGDTKGDFPMLDLATKKHYKPFT